MLELAKPILKSITAVLATLISGWLADHLGADIDATSLGYMLNSLVVGFMVWLVPNLQKDATT